MAHVKAKGFQAQEQVFELRVSQTQSLIFSLALGSASDTVTVTDAAPVVDLSTSSTGMVIEAAQMTDLPLRQKRRAWEALLCGRRCCLVWNCRPLRAAPHQWSTIADDVLVPAGIRSMTTGPNRSLVVVHTEPG